MNDSTRAGLEQLGDRGEPRGSEAVLRGARVRLRRRRARSRGVILLGTMLIVGVIATLVVMRDDGERAHEVVTQPTIGDEELGPAPPPDEGPVTLFLSDSVLPSSGAEIITVLRNTSDRDQTFSPVTGIERWDGSGWQAVGQDPPAGQRIAPFELLAPAGGTGSPVVVRIEPLDPGWYRLRKEPWPNAAAATTATGMFRVVDREVTTIDLADWSRSFLVQPALIDSVEGTLATARVELVLNPLDQFDMSSELTTWRDGRWDDVREVEIVPTLATDGTTDLLTTLPDDLAPGAYRLARTAADGAPVVGYFFVVDGVGPTIAADAPPPDDGPVTIFISASVLPSSGADVIAIVRNDSADLVTYGYGGEIERWDGASWSRVATVPEGGAYLPGFGAAPGSVGQSEPLRMGPLDPGWYRLRKDLNGGGEATGRFRVVADDVATLEIGSMDVDRLSLYPGLVPSACGSCSVRIAINPSPGRDGDRDAFEASLDDGARLDRWTGGGWQEVAVLDFDWESRVDWTRTPGERLAELPRDLTPGAYRVVRTAPDGTELSGVFFVE